MNRVLIGAIALPFAADPSEAIAIGKKKLHSVLPHGAIGKGSIYKKSIDARKRERILIVYSILIDIREGYLLPSEEKLQKIGASVFDDGSFEIKIGETPLCAPPVIVGFGPGGMFAALLLAEQGYRPIVLERGDDVEERARKVDAFTRFGVLDTSSNVQFGAGGAGTFSDGKLITRIGDRRLRYVLQIFHSLGAPDEILTNAKPHIGTDKLRLVVANMRDRIRALGGQIRFRTQMTGFSRDASGKIVSVKTTSGEIACGALLLAIGHSARDTYAMLKESGVRLDPKPISVGVRIEHRQEDIDKALFGDFAGHAALGKGEYALSRRVGDEAVYTFCMCPGGSVMAAASEEGGVVTNGMSPYARDGVNANSALVVSLMPEDGIAFQRQLERKAFSLGGGDYRAPVQTVGDYLSGKHGTEPSRVLPTYREGGVSLCDLHALFPEQINDMLALGLRDFDRKLPGFAASDAVLTGAETRTSAPVRMTRDKETFLALGYENLYPCGEGAGYAGGISSAAVDGIACALALMAQYAPFID